MIVPALLLLVGLALAGNYLYLIYSKRSRARLLLRDLQQPIKRRQQQVLRLCNELAHQVPELQPHFSRLIELGKATRNEAQGLADEDLILAENELIMQMHSLEREMAGRSAGLSNHLWTEIQKAWAETEESMGSAGEAYNQAVRKFNKSLTGFPGKWVSRVLSLTAMPILRR